ncbi:MAG: hypothetical protein JXR91_00100 [Deltaproteobacteria bacterium]|nr:hypothetical protein [Deltaproteobacteria bacterium]
MLYLKIQKFIILLLALTAVANSSCMGDSSGISPPLDELVYPVGLATVNDDETLLVVNSNFDLKYNDGTLIAIDLTKLDNDSTDLPYDEKTGVYTIKESSLDDFCDSTSTTYCNIDEKSAVDSTQTIRLGAYASDIELTPSKDRALIPVRGERAIIEVDISKNKKNLLDCGQDSSRNCDDAHRITSSDNLSFPIEPYFVRTMDYEHEENGVKIVETLGFATHRAGGEVSMFSVSRKTGDSDPVYDNKLIDVINGVVEGASGIAVNPLNGDIYVAGKRDPSPSVAVLKVLTDLDAGGSYLVNPWFSQAATISISKQMYDGSDARDIAVSPDGKTGFVVTQSPPALLKLNLETYEVTDMMSICTESSKVKLFTDEGNPSTTDDDQLYAFSLCFLTGQIYITNTEYMIPVIRKTGDGPQDIAFDLKRKLAYIANFTDSTISIIQAVPPFNQIKVKNPKDETDLRILRIGEPDLPKGY